VLLCNQGEISNQVMHRIECDLDLEDTRLEIQLDCLAVGEPIGRGQGCLPWLQALAGIQSRHRATVNKER
jgi:hypothetical protein